MIFLDLICCTLHNSLGQKHQQQLRSADEETELRAGTELGRSQKTRGLGGWGPGRAGLQHRAGGSQSGPQLSHWSKRPEAFLGTELRRTHKSGSSHGSPLSDDSEAGTSQAEGSLQSRRKVCGCLVRFG